MALVSNFNEFKIEYLAALDSDEDRLIEITASFNIEELLPSINHYHRITILSAGGTYTLGAMEGGNSDFIHFSISNGTLVLENVNLCTSLNESNHAYGGIDVGSGGKLLLQNVRIEKLLSQTVGGVWVRRGGELTLINSVINNCRGNGAGAIWVEEGAVCNMEIGSLIQDCYAVNDIFGDQILIYGTFYMNGGRVCFTDPNIVFNGIHLGEEGIFYMSAGVIDHCHTGLQIDSGSQTTITGGKIEANEFGINSILSGKRKKIGFHGGEIQGNRIGIGLNNGFDFLMTGGQIHSHLGDSGIGIIGIYGEDGHFRMTGGEIFNNIQGICWLQNTLTCQIEEGALIYGNGYGILIDHATINISGGKIYENKMPENRYSYGGIGVFVGYHGVLNLKGGEIYNNEYYGIVGRYWSTVNLDKTMIYGNGRDGINAHYCEVYMTGGSIYENGACGISLDRLDSDEPKGCYLSMKDGIIRHNGNHGICLMGISQLEMFGGEISQNGRMGIHGLQQSKSVIQDGEIYGNYYGLELTGEMGKPQDASAIIKGGKIYGNTIGANLNFKGSLILEDGEIYSNHGFLDNISNVKGGAGVWVNGGTFQMQGGKIHHHQSFPINESLGVYGQYLGAGVCLFATGTFEMISGSITDNQAPIGAGIYVPPPVVANYARVVVHDKAYFNQNKSTVESPYHYSGGILHVDTKYFFSHTSVGCHILNNYDVNYNSAQPLTRTYLDYFPDQNFACLIYEQLDREWDAYIDQCEFAPIVSLNGNERHIYSIEGAQYLMALEEIFLNKNHILDLGPLGYIKYIYSSETTSRQIKYEAYLQWRKLPNIYVSHQQPHEVFEPAYEMRTIEIPEAPINIEVTGSVGENMGFEVQGYEIEIPLRTRENYCLMVSIPTYRLNWQVPETDLGGINIEVPSYVIEVRVNCIPHFFQTIIVPATITWLELVTTPVHSLVGEIAPFNFEVEVKKIDESHIHKYNGSVFYIDDEKQRWWHNGTNSLVWWESGRNAAYWKMENFNGFVFQRSLPIPINILFPDRNLAKRMAETLHKGVEDEIEITELLRITYLDLSKNQITTLEGLQFLFNLKYLNLRETGITLSDLEKILKPDLKYMID